MTASFVAGALVALKASITASGAWHLLLPAGKWSARDGRGPYDAGDGAAMQAIVDATKARAGSTDLVVDYDHQTVFAAVPDVGGRAPAAGWIKEIAVRSDGIWGRIEWVAAAAEAIRVGEYRYISPTFVPDKSGRVRFLVSAALTNSPAIDLEAVAARTKQTGANMNNIAEALGLSADADEAAILAAIGTLKTSLVTTSATPDPAQFVPIGEFERAVSEVNRLNKGITQAAAVQHVETQIRSGSLPPALREWGVSLCTVNKTAFDSFVERTRGAFNRIIDPKGIPERGTGKRPPDLDDDALAVCRRMGITPEELVAARAFNGNETTGA